MKMEYRDFKYILSDISKIYIGAEMTYAEICAHEYAPFKLTAIIGQYLLKEASEQTSVKEHMLFLNEDSLSYRTLRQLKASLRMNILTVTKDRRGQEREKWLIDRIIGIDEYVKEETYHLYPQNAVVTELIIKKLPLMTFTV